MFVRFVVGKDTANAAWLTGIITEARILSDDGALYRHEVAQIEAAFAWFNQNLPCPPFRRMLRSGLWTRNAVCWFRAGASEPVGRVWDLVAVLREHGALVRLVKTAQPGRIVYEDRWQVVAETLRWA